MGSTGDIYSQLKELLKDTNAEVVLPTDGEKYEKAIVRWSEHCIKRASAVVFVTNAADVAATLSQIRTHNLPFTVKGGGHSTSGAASIEEGLVIDLSKMRKVSVDPTTKTITAEGGTLWEDVDVEAAKYGLATVGGTVNHTGVAGLTLGGGYGYLSGKYGLAIDNLLSVEIVLASGQIVTVSSNENSDLFWAVRGAGQNFGVTTSFTFQGYPQPDPVFAGPLIFPPTKIPQIVAFANKFHEKNDGNQALIIGFSSPPPANAPVVLTQVFHNGSEEEGKAFFKDLFDLEPLANMTGMVPYEKLNTLLNHAAGFDGRKQFSGGAVKLPLNPAFVEALHADFLQFVNSHERMNESLMMLELVPFQKICETSNESMSFANRGEYYNIATMLKWFDPSLDTEVRTFARTLLKRASESTGVAPDGKKGVGLYGNYATSDTTASEVYGENVKKLEELKHKYDPDNLFSYGTRLAPKVVAIAN